MSEKPQPQTPAFEFGLGVVVRDEVTGFTGVIVGRAQHLTGCNTYGIQPVVDDKGDFKEQRWVDEQRLKLQIHHPPVRLQNKAPGNSGNPQSTRTVG